LAAFALAACLLAPGPSSAQTEGDAQAGIAALKNRYSGGAQKAALPDASAPVDPARLRASADVIGKAGIKMSDLIDASDAGMGWTVRNVADLGPAVTKASDAVEALHQKYPSAVAEAYHWGTATNLEDTFKTFDGKHHLERGCISHQEVTFDAVNGALGRDSSLVVKKIRIGTAFQHNAVIVYPKPGADVAADPDKLAAHWKRTGVIFDGWVTQRSDPDKMTYLFKKWISFGDRPRLVGDYE
jgi:hypothetical protein